MLPTSSIALILIVGTTLFVSWRLGVKVRNIPRAIGDWWHTRKLKKLELRERAAQVRQVEAQAAAAEEAVDDSNVKRLFSWLEKRGKKN